ncbi:MAG: UDP-N-acetylglucosamine 2-epimerase (non-hydrolyzing) [Vulcanimicrobiota bacterium]
MKPLRVLTVFGTRPEAIKMAPVVLALQAHPQTEVEIAVTGQHRHILDQVLELFRITPDVDLDIMQPRQTLYTITSNTLNGMEKVLQESRAEVTLVQGDTTTAFAAGLASFYAKIPVGHVEAGLRTEDIYEPFPEEMNRRLLTTIAHYHFAPTEGSLQNCLDSGVPRERIYVTGNTVTDALLHIASDLPPGLPEGLVDMPAGARYVLVETHRRENLGEPMRQVCRAIKELVERHPDLHVVFSVHPNPAVRDVVFPELQDRARIHLLEPVDYTTLIRLIRECTLILTDSGGIQEEAPSLGKPVLVLRRQTERPEGVYAGVAELMGTDFEKIVARASQLWTDQAAYRAMSQVASPYGDGEAARRTVEALLHEIRGVGSRPGEFLRETVGA